MEQLTEAALIKIPEQNWINFIKKKYDSDCVEISDFMIGDDADNDFLELNIYCNNGLSYYCDVTEEEFLLIQNDTYIKVCDQNKKDTIQTALLEAVWISRWSQNNQGLAAVLTESEAQHIVDNIFDELEKIGYEIKKK